MHQGAPTTTATMAYPSLPASPTLTNPDMILPYGDYDSTPSPPRSAVWKGRSQDMDFAQPLAYGDNSMVAVPMTPITPIIYGNGTMLSDIGEVTEAESTPGVGVRRMRDRLARGDDSPVKSSPTMGYQSTVKRSKVPAHQRSASMESTSTVTTEAPAGEPFGDFDDTVSVDESAFQGDDEESVVGETYGQAMLAEVKTMYRTDARTVDARREKEDEELSSAALSKRAEMILSNAKQRLDNMEGNLSRARSSLYISPSSSMSSIHSSSPLSRLTPSPPEPRIISQMGLPPARHRQLNHPNLGPNGPAHARVGSENSLPLSPNNNIQKTTVISRPTLVSRQSLPPIASPQSEGPQRQDSYRSQTAAQESRRLSLNEHLDPVSGIVIMETGSDGDHPFPSPLEVDRFIRSSTAEPHSWHEIDPRALTRSASSMQMRDLSVKMKDLKGKISTLRDRAKEENMKRRSVQSLRTLSPFTAAEQWYTTSTEQEIQQKQVNNTLDHVTEDAAEDVEDYQESETTSIYQDFEEHQDQEEYGNVVDSFGEEEQGNDHEASEEPAEFENALAENNHQQNDLQDDDLEQDSLQEHVEDRELDEEQPVDDEDQDESVDGEEYDDASSDVASLYHDTSQVPLSHEDREDAFDYEHFFLHSAMGTMSQQKYGRRGSTDSYGSEDSVETTRGVDAPATGTYKDELKHAVVGHTRHKSIDTVSTMATFATAKSRHTEVDLQTEYYNFAVQHVRRSQQIHGVDTSKALPTTPDNEAGDAGQESRRGSVIKSGVIQPVAIQRPSISSFTSSSSTTRFFPLINRPRNASGTSTPSSYPSSPASNPGELLGMALTTGMLNGGEERAAQPSPVSMLHRDDQILVERLVANVGKCVVGLQETRRTSAENRVWRKRLEIAYRILDGDESLLK
ncbi:hypothetical protein VC83_01123 [Pseudogymnoascus destructans]|uniref:Uncharacterized protein n=2 Tax=Pseudogymnoascus destructans TaxID=655981 RepID=L8G3D5_PSED2|nr:uncharacterized protein VC83_01123 [Pseudogymnoascus destructans]ELR07770.1 hypothetical protein GMDG_00393 [Pseudogymnoascus destructans 20631-21]OAF62625.1 hypothetical protein VC83_01123 [Pseudogymnoascus destructans]